FAAVRMDQNATDIVGGPEAKVAAKFGQGWEDDVEFLFENGPPIDDEDGGAVEKHLRKISQCKTVGAEPAVVLFSSLCDAECGEEFMGGGQGDDRVWGRGHLCKKCTIPYKKRQSTLVVFNVCFP